MAKIIVLGAGLGGLNAAIKLAQENHNVTIYESKRYEDMGYPWRDSVSADAFGKADLDVPKEALRSKISATMYPPNCKASINQTKRSLKGFEVDRISLIRYMLDLASAKCEIKYGVTPQGLLVEDNEVRGVIAEGKEARADLVIDASGAMSVYRKEVPDFYGIDPTPLKDDIMASYRAYYKIIAPTEEFSHTYLNHRYRSGVSWCKTVDGEWADVFVGRLNELSREEIDLSVADIREKNPIFGEEKKFERINVLTVRAPLSVMVADGYVCCGDSAFMEMPLIGSGIESSLRAGKILADVIKGADNKFTAKALWQYEVKFMTTVGADFLMIDLLKRWLTRIDNEEVNWAFDSGAITQNIYNILTLDWKGVQNFTPREVLKSAGLVVKKRDMIESALKMLNTAAQARIWTMAIPKLYNREEISIWAKKYNNFLR